MSHDWMPEDVARRFSVERFYVDLKWTKIDKRVFKNVRQDVRGIMDILKSARDGCKILVEGKSLHLGFWTCLSIRVSVCSGNNF